MEQPVLLVELERDLGVPPLGWFQELERRGIAVFKDDLGRLAIDRDDARTLYAEHEEREEAAAAKRERIEEQMIAADAARRALIPRGVPVAVAGVTAAELLMALDADDRPQRESVLTHALSNPAGATIYHSVEGTTTAGGAS
jgi:hypothetical protein